jgi:hypothetical protein
MDLLIEATMEHRVVQLDLSSPEKASFAISEVFFNDKGRCVHYALNGACITAGSPAQIASELELMRRATEKPVLIESELERLTGTSALSELMRRYPDAKSINDWPGPD